MEYPDGKRSTRSAGVPLSFRELYFRNSLTDPIHLLNAVSTCLRLLELQNPSTSDAVMVTDRVRRPDALNIPTLWRSRRCRTCDLLSLKTKLQERFRVVVL
jgi:hypothetical protein